MKKLIYIAAPYTDEDESIMEARYDHAVEYAAKLFRNDSFCISPVIHCHPIAKEHDLPRNFEFWNEYCHELLTMCDELHVLKLYGWRDSKGVTSEIGLATGMGITIKYI